MCCRKAFGQERGKAIEDLIIEATGEPCPCKRGGVCPLFPRKASAQIPEQPSRHPLIFKAVMSAGLLAASCAEGASLLFTWNPNITT